MKPLVLSSCLLIAGLAGWAQDSSELFDKAPPAIDEALRARVNKFYELFIAGKFKDAYALVADDSQDKFFELSKDQYKSCEIIKVNYSENFTKAAVVTSCKADWRWHGVSTLTTFPLTSNWKVVDGQWFWHWEKPTMVPSPFSPTGFIPVPANSNTDNAGLIPKDIGAVAQGILAKVSVDRAGVQLKSYVTSREVIHLRNDMPGEVSLNLETPNVAGLKVTADKTDLKAHEETNLVFEWRLDDPAIKCLECAKTMNTPLKVLVHVEPTQQVLPISVFFDSVAPKSGASSPATQAPAPPRK